MPGSAGIAAVNGAVEALVKPLAVELAQIRVNGVSRAWWTPRGGTAGLRTPGTGGA
jgi:NAD(P)-dependent dehydrogenase (short-subunit alcohol dehydrogenase family)